MRLSAKEPILQKQINWEKVLPNLEKQIKSDAVARIALDELERSGIDRNLILRKLYMFCGGTAADARRAKAAFVRGKKSIANLSKRLTAIAEDIETAKVDLFDMGIDLQNADQVETFRSLAELLKKLADTFLKDLASGRITSRAHHLVFLVKLAESSTGRPHYREFGDLVNAVGLGFDTESSWKHSAEDVRKLVGRYGLLDFGSGFELEELKRTIKTRSTERRLPPSRRNTSK